MLGWKHVTVHLITTLGLGSHAYQLHHNSIPTTKIAPAQEHCVNQISVCERCVWLRLNRIACGARGGVWSVNETNHFLSPHTENKLIHSYIHITQHSQAQHRMALLAANPLSSSIRAASRYAVRYKALYHLILTGTVDEGAHAHLHTYFEIDGNANCMIIYNVRLDTKHRQLTLFALLASRPQQSTLRAPAVSSRVHRRPSVAPRRCVNGGDEFAHCPDDDARVCAGACAAHSTSSSLVMKRISRKTCIFRERFYFTFPIRCFLRCRVLAPPPEAVGIFFSTSSGNTEGLAQMIKEVRP